MVSDEFADFPEVPRQPATRSSTKAPPYNEPAEQAVLSACFMDEGAIVQARRVIGPESFYREAHRRIFRAVLALHDQGSTSDVLTVAAALGNELASVGGKDYLASIIDAVPTSVNVTHHAGLVRADAHRRQIIEHAADATTRAYEGANAAEIALSLTSALVPLAVDSARHEGYQRVDPFGVLLQIEKRGLGEGGSFYRSGIAALDVQTNGFKLGEMVIVGAVAKAGKSVISHQFAVNHALDGHGAAIVSAEMRASQVVERMLNARARVSVRSTTTGHISHLETERLVTAASELSRAPLWIDDAASPTFTDVRARAIALKAEHPEVTMIVVDFLQLVRYEMRGRRGDEELTNLAYGLAGLGKQLDVIMIVPCQLNYKDIERRPDKRPELMDLQGSSGMVQAADLCLLLYRPQMYFQDHEPTLELIAPAGGTRRTPAFTVTTYWRGETMTIADTPWDPEPAPTQQTLFPPKA